MGRVWLQRGAQHSFRREKRVLDKLRPGQRQSHPGTPFLGSQEGTLTFVLLPQSLGLQQRGPPGESVFPVNLLRMLGQPLLREGRNLTLLALGPVSMAAEDLFQASTQPGGLRTPSQRKDN